MIILPDDWYEKSGVRCPHLRPFKNVEAEVSAAFKWPTRIVLIATAVLILIATWVTQGCSTRTLYVSPDGTVNATVTAFGYCPEATSITAGKVKMVSEASGVGSVVTEVVGAVKP